MARLGFGMFALCSLLVAVLSLRVLVLPFEVAMAHMAHFVTEAPWRLWAHILGAPLALALAPLQMWTGMRRRWPQGHRWSGRLYGGAVLVAGVGGLTLAPLSDTSGFAQAGFVVLAVVWMGATAAGIWAAVRGDHARHRWWMQRSLALTFSAVTLRVMMAPLMAAGWTVGETYNITAWGCWLVNLAVLEWWQRRGA